MLALALTALALASPSVRAPAPVIALAADGDRVAYAAGFSATDCNRVYVWNVRAGGVTKLGRRTHCQRTSTGNSIASLALAGTRALWLHYVGGNRRTYTLWTATTARARPLLLRSVEVDADAPAPIVLGDGGGGLLPYAIGDAVVALRANGSRAFRWTAPAAVTALAAAGGDVAVAAGDGSVTVLDAAGRVLRRERFGAAQTVVRLSGGALVVQDGRSLEVRGGNRAAMYSLVAGVRLADAGGGRAVLVGGGSARVLDLADGSLRRSVRATAAALAGARLAFASGRAVSVRAA